MDDDADWPEDVAQAADQRGIEHAGVHVNWRPVVFSVRKDTWLSSPGTLWILHISIHCHVRIRSGAEGSG